MKPKILFGYESEEDKRSRNREKWKRKFWKRWQEKRGKSSNIVKKRQESIRKVLQHQWHYTLFLLPSKERISGMNIHFQRRARRDWKSREMRRKDQRLKRVKWTECKIEKKRRVQGSLFQWIIMRRGWRRKRTTSFFLTWELKWELNFVDLFHSPNVKWK